MERIEDYGFRLEEWQANYGFVWDGELPDFPGTVPEPTCLTLVGLLPLALLTRRMQ